MMGGMPTVLCPCGRPCGLAVPAPWAARRWLLSLTATSEGLLLGQALGHGRPGRRPGRALGQSHSPDAGAYSDVLRKPHRVKRMWGSRVLARCVLILNQVGAGGQPSLPFPHSGGLSFLPVTKAAVFPGGHAFTRVRGRPGCRGRGPGMAWAPRSWIVVGAPAVRFRAAQGAVRQREGRCQERALRPVYHQLTLCK